MNERRLPVTFHLYKGMRRAQNIKYWARWETAIARELRYKTNLVTLAMLLPCHAMGEIAAFCDTLDRNGSDT